MENLDGTIITTALPQIANTFNIGIIDASSGITSYLITLAIFIPISGWFADRFGSKTIFGWAIGIFTIASALCALSQSLEQFVAARILQGIGNKCIENGHFLIQTHLVGLFEHVGEKNYRTYFQHANRLLKDDGLFLLHTLRAMNALQ
jgi:MFS family permease